MKKLIFLAIFLALACSKTVDYYPLFAGEKKIYEVERIFISGNDTNFQRLKQMTKVKEKKTNDYWENVWEVVTQDSNYKPVTAFIQKTNTGIRLIQNLRDTIADMEQFKFPLEIGKSWIVAKSPNDTFIGTVLGVERVQVPVGVFDSCYKIQIKTSSADFQRLVWLAPNVGIVKNEIVTSSFLGKTKQVTLEKSILILYNTKPTKD